MLPLEVEANEGFEISQVRNLLEQLEKLGVSCETIETSGMSQDRLLRLYLQAAMPAVYKKYPIRQIFGSKRISGVNFGRGVPALVVYERDDQYPSDVYPHRARQKIVTIRAFLEDLLKRLKRAAPTWESRKVNRALAERIDRLREKIGSIDIPVVTLIREGRRR